MSEGAVWILIVIAAIAFFIYSFASTIFTWLLVIVTAAALLMLFYWVYKHFFYMVNEPAIKKRIDDGHYESALQDLADIPDSGGTSADEAVAQHLRELCTRVLHENEVLAQRVAQLKTKVTQQIQATGNLEDRLRVAKSGGGIEYEKSLLQQLARTYGLRIDHE